MTKQTDREKVAVFFLQKKKEKKHEKSLVCNLFFSTSVIFTGIKTLFIRKKGKKTLNCLVVYTDCKL